MDIQLNYTVAGQGFPLTMLHGNGEDHTRLIARSIPESQLVILPGGRFLARQNWQAFNPVVLNINAIKRGSLWKTAKIF